LLTKQNKHSAFQQRTFQNVQILSPA